MKKLVEDLPCIDIKDLKDIFGKDKQKYKIELIISDQNIQEINITSTIGNFGGFVYWFICPSCGRRVKKFYLFHDTNIFLCRYCQNSAYKTQNLREFRKTRYVRKTKEKNDFNKIIKKREELLKKLEELISI